MKVYQKIALLNSIFKLPKTLLHPKGTGLYHKKRKLSDHFMTENQQAYLLILEIHLTMKMDIHLQNIENQSQRDSLHRINLKNA